jgi:DNA-binding CsgD family transcriptional regulator
MPLRPQDGAPPVRVAVAIADPDLRDRIVRACLELDLELAESEDAGRDVDIVLADRPLGTATPVIAMTLGPIGEAWSCDVRAILPPDIDPKTLRAVIAVVAAGLIVMPRPPPFPSPRAGERRAGAGTWADATDAEETGLNEPPPLTAREREVLALLAEGASNKAIARVLGVSVHTAKFHVASLTEKLGAKGRLEAVAIAIRSGLVMV